MTLKQATAMNNKFIAMRADMDTLRMNIASMRHVADSLATHSFRMTIEAERANRVSYNYGAMFFSFWGVFVSYLQFFQ